MNINNTLMRSILLAIVVVIYIVERFVNSVYLRILAGIILIVAITFPLSKKKKSEVLFPPGEDSQT